MRVMNYSASMSPGVDHPKRPDDRFTTKGMRTPSEKYFLFAEKQKNTAVGICGCRKGLEESVGKADKQLCEHREST